MNHEEIRAMGGMGHMMKMYFHGGFTEVILFDNWRISSLGGLIWSMVIIFFLAVSYEGLKFIRDLIFKKSISHQLLVIRGDAGLGQHPETRLKESKGLWLKQVMTPMHLVQSILHMVQFVISYWLMLIFMTYNVWLCLAVTIGAGVGYFLFGSQRSLDVSDHCG
ncbi:unnamed protein product [Notodromas monacha]|uniref:Copper transport protein n=1 Tax=Notodromas monacha TaxID=399045 RepID=A0A7R9BQ76_9CRUS|nr:unnamed protein product [Notodromas monacha]CAG0918319.1 unnamed protein product [Notodromas monacha]